MIDYTYFILQNPWWENKASIENDERIKEFNSLNFKYEPKDVLNLALTPSAIHLITGPRQTGKSTAIKLYISRLLKNNFPPQAILFFNCDALDKIQEVINVILEYQKLHSIKKTAIFFDEISSIANWPQAIKWLVDNGSLRNSTLFLTGSSSIQLKKSGELLPGRRGKGEDLTFLPISFADFLALKKIEIKKKDPQRMLGMEKHLEDFLLSGGVLRNINYGLSQSSSIYLATLRSELFKAGKKEDFLREIVRKILSSLSSQTSYTNIAEEAELGSKNTAIDYLNFLSDSFFLKEVKFYDINQNRLILKKNKKYYTTDPYFVWLFTGFVTGGTDFTAMKKMFQNTAEKSKIVENFVASELYKKGYEFFFYQNSRELDFYLPKEKLAIEVKYKNRITSEDLKPVKLEILPREAKRIVITKNTYEKRGHISLIPAHLFALTTL